VVNVGGYPDAVFSGLVLYFYFGSGCRENCYIAKGAVEAAIIGGVAPFRGFGAFVLRLLLAAGVGGWGRRAFGRAGLGRHA